MDTEQCLELVEVNAFMRHESLNEENRDLIEKLNQYQAPFLMERMITKGKVQSEAEFDLLFREFKRFVALHAVYGSPMNMLSSKVDEVWHEFLLFTKEYQQFCRNILGYFFHHSPKTTNNPLDPNGSKRFISFYQEHYGNLPACYNTESCGDCSDIGTDCHGDGQCGGDGE